MNDRAALKAGTFILLMIALALAMVVAIAGTGSLFKDVKRYTVEFEAGENVANLRPDAQVRMLGVPIGLVESVQAVPVDGGAVVRVGIHLPAEFLLHQDALVKASTSLTGDAWLDIDDVGQPEAGIVANGGTLDGQVLGFAQIVEQAQSVIPVARQAIERIDAAAGEAQELIALTRGHVDPLVASVSRVADSSGEAADHLRDLLGDTKTDLRGTVASLRETLDTARARLPETMDRVDATLDDTRTAMADARQLLASARASLDRLPALLDNAEPALADLRETVATAKPRLDRALSNLSRASDDAAGAMVEIRAAPWRLLAKPSPDEDRNLAIYSLARQYARGAQDLESAARALDAASQTAGTSEDLIQQLRDDLVLRIDRFDRFERELWAMLQP